MVVKVTGAPETPTPVVSVTVTPSVTVVPAATGEVGVAVQAIEVGTPKA